MPLTLASVDGTFVNPNSYDAGELRRADAALVSSAGISSGLVVSVDASDNVTVTAGNVVIDAEDAVTGAGVYRAGIAANVVGLLAGDTARDGTNPRIHRVVFRQYDTDVVGSHPRYKSEIEVIPGAPAATPSAPALPSMAEHLALITLPPTGGGAATVDSSGRVLAKAIGVGVETDTGWVAVTGVSPFVADGALRKIGNRVYTRGVFSRASGSSASYTTVFTAPAGFRPSIATAIVVGGPSSGTIIGTRAQVLTTGEFQVAMSGANSNNMNFGGVTWLVD